MDIKSILASVETAAIGAARDFATGELEKTGKEILTQAAHDAIDFVAAALPALERYIKLLMDGSITKEEFASLMGGLKDIASLNGLTAAGLTAIQVDNTKGTIVKTITSLVIGAVSKI